jgi:hypothetical protein
MAAQTAPAFYPRLSVCVSTLFICALRSKAVAIYCEITLTASENNYKSAKLLRDARTDDIHYLMPCAQLISRRLQRYKSATATSAFELIAPWCFSLSLC